MDAFEIASLDLTLKDQEGRTHRMKNREGLGIEQYGPVLEALLKLMMDRFGDDLVSLVLYGSVARGEARAGSDVDLLVVLEDPPGNYHRRVDMVLDVELELAQGKEYRRIRDHLGMQPYFAYIILSREEARENRYLYLDMVEDAVILHDRDSFFARKLGEMRKRLEELGSKRIKLDDGTWYWDLKPDLKPGEVFTL